MDGLLTRASGSPQAKWSSTACGSSRRPCRGIQGGSSLLPGTRGSLFAAKGTPMGRALLCGPDGAGTDAPPGRTATPCSLMTVTDSTDCRELDSRDGVNPKPAGDVRQHCLVAITTCAGDRNALESAENPPGSTRTGPKIRGEHSAGDVCPCRADVDVTGVDLRSRVGLWL